MKSFKKIYLSVIAVIFTAAIIATGCKKDTAANNDSTVTAQKLSLYLTDDPGRFDSVYIDIKYVEVKTDTSAMHRNDDHFNDHDNDHAADHQNSDQFGKWDTLGVSAGIYNIARLKNGIDTLLGTANIKGTIRKIRLTLGTNNSVLLTGVSYPLNFTSGVNNYLYVKINEQHHHQTSTASTALWVDFDISRSIKYINGKYYLNPVLRPFCDNNFATISGKVLPAAANPIVTVFNSTDTANALPERAGNYKVRGLKAGTYNILFKGYNGYKDTTIKNLQVITGKEQIIPTVTLSL